MLTVLPIMQVAMTGSPRDRLPPCVVLVHGINHDGHQFDPLKQYLEAHGIQVQAINLDPANGSAGLVPLAEQLVDFIRAVVRLRLIQAEEDLGALASGTIPEECRIHLCGFSMGGLVSRIAFQQHGGSRYVKSLISLAAPHHGTIMAHLRFIKGVREMRPWSSLLRSLNARITQDATRHGFVQFTQIWTPWDCLIVPPFSGRLPVGRNLMLPAGGHNRLIESAACFAEVLRAIEEREAIPEGEKVG